MWADDDDDRQKQNKQRNPMSEGVPDRHERGEVRETDAYDEGGEKRWMEEGGLMCSCIVSA